MMQTDVGEIVSRIDTVRMFSYALIYLR